MKLTAVAVAATNIPKTIEFYSLIGFDFSACDMSQQHLEAVDPANGMRLMIDSASLIEEIIGEPPRPGNTSVFAVEFESAQAVNDTATKLQDAGFSLKKEPWDAFWGQRYCVAQDPDGFLVDLYAPL